MEVVFLSDSMWHMGGLLLFSLPDFLHIIKQQHMRLRVMGNVLASFLMEISIG